MRYVDLNMVKICSYKGKWDGHHPYRDYYGAFFGAARHVFHPLYNPIYRSRNRLIDSSSIVENFTHRRDLFFRIHATLQRRLDIISKPEWYYPQFHGMLDSAPVFEIV